MSESILEKALLEAEQLEETMKSNAKEILSSTMKEEIQQLVKESLTENDYLKEQEEEEEVDIIDMDDDMESEELEMEPEVYDDIELDMEDETDDIQLPELPPLDLTLASDGEVLKVFKAMGDEDGIIIQKDGDEIDLTDANTDTEYIIKLDEQKKSKTMKKSIREQEDMEDMDNMDEMDIDEMEDDVVYEIELDEDFDESGVMGVDAPESEEAEDGYDMELGEEMDLGPEDEVTEDADWGSNKDEYKRRSSDGVKHRAGDVGGGKYGKGGHYKDYEGEMDEASRTLGFGRESNGKHKPSGIRKAISNNRNLGESRIRKSYNLLKEEVETLKVKNSDYRKALTTFKDKLNEVGVFNSNLAYVTRLFTEHSTTKQEKINVLRRFDGVNSLKGSKVLYKVIKEELTQDVVKHKKTISESVQKKITKSPTSGGKLLESKVYENPQFSRMKDLMSKIK